LTVIAMIRNPTAATQDKVHQLFGAEFPKVLEAMNRELAA
jgi:hypothetical protein